MTVQSSGHGRPAEPPPRRRSAAPQGWERPDGAAPGAAALRPRPAPSRRDPARWRRHPRERPRPRGGRRCSAPSRPAPPGLIDDSEPLRKGRARCESRAAPVLQSAARSLGTRRVSPFFHVLTHFCSKKNRVLWCRSDTHRRSRAHPRGELSPKSPRHRAAAPHPNTHAKRAPCRGRSARSRCTRGATPRGREARGVRRRSPRRGRSPRWGGPTPRSRRPLPDSLHPAGG